MKKLLLSTLCFISLCLVSNAQLRVLSNGHTQIGYSNLYPTLKVDTTSNISVFGNMADYSGGLLSFGGRNHVSIGESPISPGSTAIYRNTGALHLTGLGGLKYTSYYGDVFSFNPIYRTAMDPETGEKIPDYGIFSFKVNISAKQFLTSSDARYKTNIKSIENNCAKFNFLNPVSYNISIPLNEREGENENSRLEKNTQAIESSNSPLNFGFIAQEVLEIYPNLVFEDEDGMLSIDYNGFIPLIVEQVKTLNAKVAEQEKIIYSLTSGAKKTRGIAGVEELYGEDKIVLLQNRPNPFKSSTEIRCHLPQEVSEAFICIYDLNGRQQMRLDIRDRGDVAVTVSGNALQPGMYIYSLIADGQEADSKRMILTE